MQTTRSLLLAPLLALAGSSCMSLDYDLASVPMPVSAKPAEPGAAEVEPFTIEARQVLWLHGAFGRSSPDVAALLAERAEGWDRVASLRVRPVSNFHHWLATHLSLTVVRMRTVVIEGELVRDGG